MIGDVILSVNGYGENALPADGRLVSIATYDAAFQLLGTNFGGRLDHLWSAGSAGVCATGTAVLHLPVGIFPSHLETGQSRRQRLPG
jgi:Phage Tail Collar Domain